MAGQPTADRDREPRLRRALLRIPHGLPRVQRRFPARDPVPAQLRRLRLRPGDLRPDPRAAGAGGRDPDPDALLPRGVIGRFPHGACAMRSRRYGCSRASGWTPAGHSCASPPHVSRRGRRTDPRGAGDPGRVRARDPGLPARPRRARLRQPRGLDRYRARVSRSPTVGRRRSARPPIRSSWRACTSSAASSSGATRVEAARIANVFCRHRDRGADRADRLPAVGPARGIDRAGPGGDLRPADTGRPVRDERAVIRALPTGRSRPCCIRARIRGS